MLVIGVCDDIEDDRNVICDSVSKAMFDLEEIQIHKYASGCELMDSIKNHKFHCNLLFLDICMSPVTGMDVAEFLRKENIDVDIIFITNSTAHVYQGYTYKAYAYILKKTLQTEIRDTLLRYTEELKGMSDTLNVTSNGVVRHIQIKKIYFVDSHARLLTIHMQNEEISFYAKMSDLEPVLSEYHFSRIHQSYIVNEKMVTARGRDFVMLGELKLPVSRKYSRILKLKQEDMDGE